LGVDGVSKKTGKRYSESKKLLEDKGYSLPEAIALLKKMPKAKFDETIEIAFRLGIDPKQADQQVRGTLSLPHGVGKERRVLVFAKGEAAKEATSAGADFVGGEELIEKIKGGWMEFDAVVATPDVMKEVGKIGRLLGPRGLMPNPKTGTVTTEIGKTVDAIKKGRVEFRSDKSGNVHLPVGKKSFDDDRLQENILAVIAAVKERRASSCKGAYIHCIAISSTMGPSVKLNSQQMQ
jgi:large subunit ribosomal protein L1